MTSERLEPEDLYRRLRDRDLRLFPLDHPSTRRLGWLEAARRSERSARELRRFADVLDEETVVACAFGEAAQAAAAFAAAAPVGGRRLIVCDDGDPDVLTARLEGPCFVLVLGSPESEQAALGALSVVLERVPAARVAVVGPEDGPLCAQASARNVARIFASPADIPEGFGALGPLGAVPAALVGLDPEELCGRVIDVDGPRAMAAGLALAADVVEGRGVRSLAPSSQTALMGWHTAVLATATCRDGTGCLALPSPESGEDTGDRATGEGTREGALVVPDVPGVRLGEVMHAFQLAAFAAGWALGVDPLAGAPESGWHARARRPRAPGGPGVPDAAPPEEFHNVLDEHAAAASFIVISSFLPGAGEDALARLGAAVSARAACPVLVGPGARVLSCIGDALSDGPPGGLVVHLVSKRPPPPDARGDDLSRFWRAAEIAEIAALDQSGRRRERVGLDALEELG